MPPPYLYSSSPVASISAATTLTDSNTLDSSPLERRTSSATSSFKRKGRMAQSPKSPTAAAKAPSGVVGPPAGKGRYLPNRIKRYHVRSLTGCLTCRKRRVKCDEAKPVCKRCKTANRECCFPEVVSAGNSQAHNGKARASSVASPGESVGKEGYASPPVSHKNRTISESTEDGSLSSMLVVSPSSEASLGSTPTTAIISAYPKDQTSEPSTDRRYHLDVLNASSDLNLSTSLNSAHTLSRSTIPHHPLSTTSPSASSSPTFEVADRRESMEASASGPLSRDPYQHASLANRPPASIDTGGPGYQHHRQLQRCLLPPKLLLLPLSPSELNPFFPTVEQQSLFRHYIQDVAPQLCVIPVAPEKNQWIQHHARFALRTPSGQNGYEDSLRSALLSIAALDIGYRLANTGETNDLGASSMFLELSSSRRAESLALLRATLALRDKHLQRDDAALLLAIVLGLATRDRLAAHEDWQEALQIAQKAIAELGGPAAFLDYSDRSSLFLIEQIACFEVLGSLTSDESPTFLQPWDDWWYRLMDSPTKKENDGVEQTYGLHRGMIDMLARMTRVEATRRELQDQSGTSVILSDEPGKSRITRTSLSGISSEVKLSPEHEETMMWLEATAAALLAEIPVWANMPSNYRDSPPGFEMDQQSSSANQVAVRALGPIMNQLYVATAEVYMQSVTFAKPATDPCFNKPVSQVLRYCKESIRVGITKGLLLPLSMVSFAAHGPTRDEIKSIFEDLRPYHKFDLRRMEELCIHTWSLVDRGLTPSDWRLFLKSVGCFTWAF
ncbi:hypothetical protein IE53DRAFT_159891 [Violaceomyces palustris]|uniref:Uncharacterized protein n=1 Tax=Violaceomyces palustris TaxID=1673888 RepID=A0ACD0NTL2_9BASI|nr:hypothetical protein IE53DRAFT_159891 [Violaceomyces palustris]